MLKPCVVTSFRKPLSKSRVSVLRLNSILSSPRAERGARRCHRYVSFSDRNAQALRRDVLSQAFEQVESLSAEIEFHLVLATRGTGSASLSSLCVVLFVTGVDERLAKELVLTPRFRERRRTQDRRRNRSRLRALHQFKTSSDVAALQRLLYCLA